MLVKLVLGFDGGLGEVFADDVADVAGANFILRDTAGFEGLRGAEGWSPGLKLAGSTGYDFYQAVLVVEGAVIGHAFSPRVTRVS